ncbi:hypothetical protein B5K11_17810 [Rhizobium leguminosarum bv. trifolii]|nr:hypothetical protein B5K11_17810 [Rhizobium leguminosarum bv. trifolii]
MFGFFHPYATYGPLPQDLAAGSERLHAEASADAAFQVLLQRENRRCLALISMPSTTKLIHIYAARSLIAEGRKLTGYQTAVSERRSRGASKFVIKVLR